MSKSIPRPLTGFKDLSGQDATVRQWLTDRWRDVTASYGYEPYVVPTVESRALYEAKGGDALVGDSYAVTTRSQEVGLLRPELTPSLVRQIAAVANTLPRPARRAAAGLCFRAERPQKGRLREFLQLNVDLFGVSSPAADAEILTVAIDCLRATGLTSADVSFRLSDRPLLISLSNSLGITTLQLPALWPLVDALPKIGPAATLDALTPLLGAATAQKFLALLTTPWPLLASQAATVSPDRTKWLTEVLNLLSAQGLSDWITIDLSIVRGLGYYTGLVFEAFAVGEPRALLGGGRYDNLVETLGGPPLSAIGFGLGETVLKDALSARALVPDAASLVDISLALPPSPASFALARSLRALGFKVAMPLLETSSSKQVAAAYKSNIANIIRPSVAPNALTTNSTDANSFILKRPNQEDLCVSSLDLLSLFEKMRPPNV